MILAASAQGDGNQPAVRRVLLALYPGGFNRVSLDLALKLAQHMDAELSGVWVEDIDLLRAAALPFTCELTHAGGEEREFGAEGLERSLRAEARRFREYLAEQARLAGVRSSFNILRGKRHLAVLGELKPTDLLVTAKVQRRIWSEPSPSGHIVALRHETIAEKGWQLLRGVLDEAIGVSTAPAYEELQWDEPGQILSMLHARRPGLVILPVRADPEGRLLRELLDRLECPLLLVP